MEGIQFVTDEKGRRVAVQIDLSKHGELWEDFYDSFLAHERQNEPREGIDSVRNRLREQGKLYG
jgi:hypothetical protein